MNHTPFLLLGRRPFGGTSRAYLPVRSVWAGPEYRSRSGRPGPRRL